MNPSVQSRLGWELAVLGLATISSTLALRRHDCETTGKEIQSFADRGVIIASKLIDEEDETGTNLLRALLARTKKARADWESRNSFYIGAILVELLFLLIPGLILCLKGFRASHLAPPASPSRRLAILCTCAGLLIAVSAVSVLAYDDRSTRRQLRDRAEEANSCSCQEAVLMVSGAKGRDSWRRGRPTHCYSRITPKQRP
jgi:hypothetical protein